MLVGFLVLLAAGVPMAWAMLTLALGFGYEVMGSAIFTLTLHRTWEIMNSYSFIAIPLFILMANMLRVSGIADELYDAIYHWMGGIPAGLAVATIITCTIMAAMVGTGGAGISIMGLVALPAMLSREYNKQLALGTIMAGGALGVMIPPSIMFVMYGIYANVSIGGLFMGGIGPGLLMAGLYIAYAMVRSFIDPTFAPSDPEARKIPWSVKLGYLRTLAPPIILIAAVLGTIYFGIATVGEAAGVGAFGATIAAALRRQLTWKNLQEALRSSMMTTGMIMWIVFGATAFVGVIQRAGAAVMISNFIQSLTLGPWATLGLLMGILFVLGMFLDVVGIVILTVPIFAPVIASFGFDPLWFGILVNMVLQVAYLSPPFGYAMFYLKGVAPRHVTTLDLYRAVVPFMALQLVALILVIVFPQIATWLPSRIR